MRHTPLFTALSSSALLCSVTHAGTVSHDVLLGHSSSAGSETTTTFHLFDHPGGMASPQAYGLRLDSFDNTSTPITFSFEDADGNSTVQLVVTESSDGTVELNIVGTVNGNSADAGIDYGEFALDLTYIVDASSDGWEDNNQSDGILLGGLTGMNTTLDSPLGNGDFFELFGKSDGADAFRFLADGHRVMGSMDEWVGRGWVMGADPSAGGINDLLFTAQIVPLPPAALGGIGLLAGLGVYRRLNRRG